MNQLKAGILALLDGGHTEQALELCSSIDPSGVLIIRRACAYATLFDDIDDYSDNLWLLAMYTDAGEESDLADQRYNEALAELAFIRSMKEEWADRLDRWAKTPLPSALEAA